MNFRISTLLLIYLFAFLLEGAASLPADVESPSLKRKDLPGKDSHILDDDLGEIVDEAVDEDVGHTREPRAAHDLPGFKYLFIDENGQIYRDREAGPKLKLEIAGSPRSSYRSLYAAAFVAINMTRHVHPYVFQALAYFGSVGIFTDQERLTVFPEFGKFRNPWMCRSSCTGLCEVTCRTDGSKVEDAKAFFSKRAVTVESNVMCTWRNPYKNQSALVHELAHALHVHTFPPLLKDAVKEAYLKALQHKRWPVDSYAMSNEFEYFAVAAPVYFGVDRNRRFHEGGMNWCDGHYCATEMEARRRLKASDPDIFRILSQVFVGGNPNIKSHMTICPDSALLDQYMSEHNSR